MVDFVLEGFELKLVAYTPQPEQCLASCLASSIAICTVRKSNGHTPGLYKLPDAGFRSKMQREYAAVEMQCDLRDDEPQAGERAQCDPSCSVC